MQGSLVSLHPLEPISPKNVYVWRSLQFEISVMTLSVRWEIQVIEPIFLQLGLYNSIN